MRPHLLLTVLLAAAVALSGCTSTPPTEVRGIQLERELPAVLPDGATVFSSDRSGTFEILVDHPSFAEPYAITHDTVHDSFMPRLSPDRRRVVFHRSPAGTNDGDYTRASIWLVDVDGTDLRELSPVGANGWGIQGHPEWSPDGSELVLFAGPAHNSQIVTMDLAGRPTRLVTLRGGMNLDPTWGPAGEWIYFVGCPQSACEEVDYEIYRVRPDRSGLTRLTDDRLRDHDPAVSPDGRRLAWLTERDPDGGPVGPAGAVGAWDVRVMELKGNLRKARWSWLTHDDTVNSRPTWDPVTGDLYLHRLPVGEPRFQLYRLDPGTGGLERIMASAASDEYPSR